MEIQAPAGDVKRGLVWLIVATGMIFAAAPASAQRYDPAYSICMEVYGSDGSRIECFYTSMAQCKEGAGRGVPGLCFDNPYYVAPVAEAAPAPPATPARSPRH
jgi:hypothetical protein